MVCFMILFYHVDWAFNDFSFAWLQDKAIEPADASEHVDESLQTIVRQIEEET